jgi:hypothetical protein
MWSERSAAERQARRWAAVEGCDPRRDLGGFFRRPQTRDLLGSVEKTSPLTNSASVDKQQALLVRLLRTSILGHFFLVPQHSRK